LRKPISLLKEIFRKKMKYALVLSYGGMTGLSFLGGLSTVDLSHVTHFYGTSVGAILCCFLACGITPLQIFFELCQIESFLSMNLKNLFREDEALIPSGTLHHILCSAFHKHVQHIPTFADLAGKGKYLHVYTYCMTSQNIEEFSYKKSPNSSVFGPIVASACVPVLFQPYVIDNKEYIDGAFANPFPVENALEDFPPSEIIAFYTTPWTGDEVSNKKLRQALIVLNIGILTLMKKSIERISSEMLAVNFYAVDIPGISDLTLEQKFTQFLNGLRKVKNHVDTMSKFSNPIK